MFAVKAASNWLPHRQHHFSLCFMLQTLSDQVKTLKRILCVSGTSVGKLSSENKFANPPLKCH